MLTRSQVAQRIGRSVATVRKMEGAVLHPRVDQHGVYRFAPEEVEAVAARIRATGRALDAAPFEARSASSAVPPDYFELFAKKVNEDDSLTEREEEFERITSERDELRRALEGERRAREQLETRDAQRAREEAAATTAMALNLLDDLESLSLRQRRRILREEPDILETVEALLKETAQNR